MYQSGLSVSASLVAWSPEFDLILETEDGVVALVAGDLIQLWHVLVSSVHA